MKILLSAFSICPDWGSEPSVGWNVAMELSRKHRVWVLAEKIWKKRIEERVNLSDYPNLTFVYVDIGWLHELAEYRFNTGVTWLIYYYLWQFKALQVAKSLHQHIGFDLAQHITFVKANVPSHLYRLPLPFIFGPVGGGEIMPNQDFLRDMDWKNRVKEKLRELHLTLAKFDPWLRTCVRRSAAVIGVTQQSQRYLQSLHPKKSFSFPAISLLEKELPTHRSIKHSLSTLRLIYVGRLLQWKGLHLAFKALAIFRAQRPEANVELLILGEGPEKAALMKLSQELRIDDGLKFLGHQSRDEVLRQFDQANALLFPSLHDSGGFVVIEAMSRAIPAIVVATGGPDFFVDDHSGWKIQPTHRHSVVQGLANVLLEIHDHPQLLTTKGEAARQRVLDHFTTPAQIRHFEEIYKECI